MSSFSLREKSITYIVTTAYISSWEKTWSINDVFATPDHTFWAGSCVVLLGQNSKIRGKLLRKRGRLGDVL